jgi:hypothetical protein
VVPRTVTTAWCTELGTTLLNGFTNTTDNPAYFRCLNSFSVHHPVQLRWFLPHWSRHAGAPLLSKQSCYCFAAMDRPDRLETALFGNRGTT